MIATLDNIISEMGSAWRRQFADMPLILSDESKTNILRRAKDYRPHRLLAMWIMYIGDEREKDWGLTIDRFLRDDTLNRWAARLGAQTVSKGGRLSNFPSGYNAFICEHSFQLCVTPPTFCWGEVGYPNWDGKTPLPDRHPELCPFCKGAMYRINSGEYKRLHEKRNADLMALPDPVPVVAKDLGEMVFPSKPAPVQEVAVFEDDLDAALKEPDESYMGFDDDIDEIGGTEIDFF